MDNPLSRSGSSARPSDTPQEGILVDCRPSHRKTKSGSDPASTPEVSIPKTAEAPPPTAVSPSVAAPTLARLVKRVLGYGFLAITILAVLLVVILRDSDKAAAQHVERNVTPPVPRVEPIHVPPIAHVPANPGVEPSIPVPPLDTKKPMGIVPVNAPKAVALIQRKEPRVEIVQLPPVKRGMPLTLRVAGHALRVAWAQLSLPEPEIIQAKKPDPPMKETECYETAIEFVKTPQRAMELSTKDRKLMMLLQVSGNFEDPGFT